MATLMIVHERSLTSREFRAFQLRHIAFTVASIFAGLDKFFDLMMNWDGYLAPWIARRGYPGIHDVGWVLEIIAGAIVAVRPPWGEAYVVALWLCGIIINLLSYPGFYDIALRDFGLMLGAIALGRLSSREVRLDAAD